MGETASGNISKVRRNLYLVLYVIIGTLFFIGLIFAVYTVISLISQAVITLFNINFETTVQVPVQNADGSAGQETVPGISAVGVALFPALVMVSFALSLWLYSVLTKRIAKKLKLHKYLPQLFPDKKIN